MSHVSAAGCVFKRSLEPMERISEILFALIMALGFTCTLGVVTADNAKVQTMLFGALGCNLAWGIIDAGVYLLARLNDRGRTILMHRAIHEASELGAAQRIIADALPPWLASALPPAQLESIRQKLRDLPEPPGGPRLTMRDWIGALGLCLLSFLSTFPIVVPFVFIGDVKLALRVSNGVAIVMLFFCGYAFGYRSGLRPRTTAIAMVAVGAGLVGIAIALGG